MSMPVIPAADTQCTELKDWVYQTQIASLQQVKQHLQQEVSIYAQKLELKAVKLKELSGQLQEMHSVRF